MTNSWYSAKCIFRLKANDSRRQRFEERIVLIRADGLDEAIEKAEKNAEKYREYNPGIEFTGFVEVFEFFDDLIECQTELFSSLRVSDLNSTEYLDRFYPEIPGDCEKVGQAHSWYRKDGLAMGCYNCSSLREVD
jgi:uncharacterized protein DUF4288